MNREQEQTYSPQTIVLGVLIALAIVLVAIVAFNAGEIWGIIQTEGLLSE